MWRHRASNTVNGNNLAEVDNLVTSEILVTAVNVLLLCCDREDGLLAHISSLHLPRIFLSFSVSKQSLVVQAEPKVSIERRSAQKAALYQRPCEQYTSPWSLGLSVHPVHYPRAD